MICGTPGCGIGIFLGSWAGAGAWARTRAGSGSSKASPRAPIDGRLFTLMKPPRVFRQFSAFWRIASSPGSPVRDHGRDFLVGSDWAAMLFVARAPERLSHFPTRLREPEGHPRP